jgi:FdhD protein
MTHHAALIAGGRSTRMGADKAFLDWKGRPLYATQLEKLIRTRPAGPILLSANREQPFPGFIDGVRIIRDSAPDLGPIGALRDCLAAVPADANLLVLAIDLPGMTTGFLNSLITSSGAGRGVVPQIQGQWEPLAAVYPAALLPLVTVQIDAGELSLRQLCDRAAAEGWMDALPVPADDEALFANMNTRGEYETIQQGLFDSPTRLHRFSTGTGFIETHDRLAAEEPLEIRVEGRSVAVVMRTPGHDDELAAGFLLTESAIRSADDLREISRCRDLDPDAAGNALDVTLAPDHRTDLDALTRHVFTSSSCGVCGKATIESVFQQFPPVDSPIAVSPEILLSLPEKLREAQATFQKTGGLHASALFDERGNLESLREDVGRHNALDKVIGRALLDGRLPLHDRILLVSGRISFELVQKALAAGIPIIAGISAPSSLAVDLARRGGQTLVGFLRERSFNVYTGHRRITDTPH